jgi:hypothetical protein
VCTLHGFRALRIDARCKDERAQENSFRCDGGVVHYSNLSVCRRCFAVDKVEEEAYCAETWNFERHESLVYRVLSWGIEAIRQE